MKTIVTHPGSAHRDEFISSCLLIAEGKADCIERRDPTEEDLNDSNVIVLDQGGQLDDWACNYDHHQLDRGHEPCCAITLVIEHELKIDLALARSIWSWLEFSELLDSKGPFETAKRLGSNPDALFAGTSPVETVVLQWFQSCKTIDAATNQELWKLMFRVGQDNLDYLAKVVKRLDRLYNEATDVYIDGLKFVDATCIDRDDNPVLGLEIYCQQMGDVAGTITNDDRGKGVSLFRRNDHPRLDFSRVEEVDGVVFAHKGGFVAKLAAGVDPLPMLEAAIVPAEPEVPLILQQKQHVIDVRIVCNSEPVPGWGHDPQDMVKAAAKAAAEVLGSYDPIVINSEVKDLKVDELTPSETAALLRHMTKEEV